MPHRSARSVVLLTTILTVLALGAGGLLVPAAADGYTPRPGITTNNPLGDPDRRDAILRKLIRTIDSAPRRSKIRVASWNVRSDRFVDALIRAHRRHATVRLIIARGNANASNPNEGFHRLREALSRGNDKRRKAYRSRVRRCAHSCRGTSGISHSKFFLFTHAGRARHVVINGSANATDLSATHQWNDVFTVRDRPKVFGEFRAVFHQMWRDRRVAQGYRTRHFDRMRTSFHPYTGARTSKDPVLKELGRVRCSGALDGVRGHTRIRIAMTSWYGDRGTRIATRVRRLKNRGCDVRIVYAVMGNEVLRILRREGPRPVPMRQIVQDFDGDGVYDRYLHMKVLTIRGVYRDSRRAWVTVNGSANWSPAVLASDEAVLRIRGKRYVQRYNGWIDHLYHHPPRSRPVSPAADSTGGKGAGRGRPTTHRPVNPYAKIQPH